MTICELRLKAAEIIEERGWWQGGFDGPNGECCMLEALYAAENYVAFGSVTRAAQDMGFGGIDPIVSWNDAPGRTKAEVLDRLRDGCREGVGDSQ